MTTKPKYRMIPYRREDRDIYIGLEFDPENLAEVLWPGNMFQEPGLMDVIYLLNDHFVGATGRKDVLVSGVAFICYDHSNLNVRIGPDCLVAIGVDALAIRHRRLYLPWEVGKAPDFVLEWASDSTAENDMGHKRDTYESIGVGEYWRFDLTGGRHYGEPMIGERLVNGRYERFDLIVEADGAVRGYSPALDLVLSWERQEDGQGLMYLYDPATGQRLEPHSTLVASRRAEAAESRAETAEARAEAAEAETERLREQLRRLGEK